MAHKSKRKEVPKKLNFLILEIAGKILETAIKYGFCLGVSYYVYQSFDALAGLETNAKIDLSATIKTCESANWPYWLAALCSVAALSGVAYGYGQLQARRETIATMTAYTTRLEKQLDKNRSGSGISRDGSTRPGDE